MKLTLYKLFLLAFLLPLVSFASNDLVAKHTKDKTIKKEFKVSRSGILDINNNYGNVDISTWNENRIVIQVFIKTSGNDLERVQNKLDDISVEFHQSGNLVSAETHYQKEDRSWWSGLFSSNNNVNMEINYVIKAPANHDMVIDNDYGAIYIDKVLGNTDISCDYGKIDIGELRGRRNILNFDYTRNCHFGYISSAEIDADYSGFTIEEAEELIVSADYSDSNIEKVSRLKFNCDYGSIRIDKVKHLNADGDYLSTKIGRVFGSLNINQDYGSITIEKLINGLESVYIDTDYAGIRLGYDAEMDFVFDVQTSYGGVKGTEDLEITKRHDRNTSKDISGYYGNQNSRNSINISTSYGSVSFQKVR
ncbi:hypothetical protein [Zunongwangia sp. HGR-M22]|uniref:hypothetical protein n=1 Tax=Zunongwangia sp. HGR-M22 TaxID=3015168 RepID=UPI0022DDC525|nr:hypothetical protein [Zunongwangia sp. HGR-M22]WBL24458.1 hypothetical protein PBT91_11095 [Zunongwangia sp. HGR-M22]